MGEPALNVERKEVMPMCEWRDFYGLYAEGWGDRLVAEAFAHP